MEHITSLFLSLFCVGQTAQYVVLKNAVRKKEILHADLAKTIHTDRIGFSIRWYSRKQRVAIFPGCNERQMMIICGSKHVEYNKSKQISEMSAFEQSVKRFLFLD